MRKKFYITTSIAYTNAPPHIGYALELLQADVLARYRRFLKEDVFFLTGTDEHGQKIAKAAEEAGKSPQEFVDDISGKFRELTKVLNLSNDNFIRTTDKKNHWPNVEKLWNKLRDNEDIYKKSYKGFYCVGCEAFIKEKDLVDGKCPIHQKKPEFIEEENYFFKLSKYASQVKEEIENNKIKIVPEARKNEILSFIGQGVEDISCSRSKENLKWGIPVPGDKSQIIYIWFEALINYLFPEKYWPADVHCVGKDIFRFHALLWPAMLIGAGLGRPKCILVHGFITSGGQKMSKSLGNVVDPFELIKKYGCDALRYFLLREIPPTEDGDFTEEKLKERYNADLAGGIGNLVARVITLANKFKTSAFASTSAEASADKKATAGKQNSKLKTMSLRDISRRETTQNSKLKNEIDNIWGKYKKSLEEFKFNEALIAIWELISFCDAYIDKEQPWKESDSQKEVISDLLFAISNIAEILKPFLPEASERISKQLFTLRSEPLFPRIK